MITSTGNAQVKKILQLNKKAKARRECGLFVAEGIKMFREAPRKWIDRVYVSSSLWESGELEKELPSVPFEVVADAAFYQMCDTKTPQGVLTVLKMPSYSLEELLDVQSPLFVFLEDLQDPGNVGTILRTAEGAGVSAVFVSDHTADLFQPKVIRSTMGAIYRVPFYRVAEGNMDAFFAKLREKHICSYAAHLQGEKFYDQEDYSGGTVFLIGNEGNGLSDRLCEHADRRIRIPMQGHAESLNAAMAAGILLYECFRQRRRGDSIDSK